MSTDFPSRMRQLIGTPAEWAANNLVLGVGEIAIEQQTDGTARLKVGDGTSTYSALAFGPADLGATLRAPFAERPISALPSAASRASRLLGFDAAGQPQAVAPNSQDASSLATSLADTVNPAKNSGQVGFASGLAYAVGTVGAAIKALITTPSGVGDADTLAATMAAAAGGTATSIEFYGDSTMWGADPTASSTQVGTPPPAAAQYVLRSFMNNVSVTCVNKGLSGTNCAQMIAGTDGSGSTFDAKMAATVAKVVFCNHGINDATGAAATTPGVFKANLTAFVKSCRKYGKSPVLVTPNINTAIGTLGTPARVLTLRHFVGVVHQVAREYAVPVVDNFAACEKMLAGGKYTPLQLVGDGVHPTPAVYQQLGRNMVAPLLPGLVAIAGDQISTAHEGGAAATNAAALASTASRVGGMLASGSTSNETVRFLVLVEQPRLDLYLAHPVWNGASPNFSVNVDELNVASSYSMNANYPGSDFVHDYETCIAENIDAGLHLVQMISGTVNQGLGVNYLRTRPAVAALRALKTNATAQALRQRLLTGFSSAQPLMLLDHLPSSRLLHSLVFEFVAQLAKNTGFVCHGYWHGGSVTPGPGAGFIVGLNGSGFAHIWEATAPNTYVEGPLGAVDLSLAAHTYTVTVTNGRFGTMSVSVDGGAPITYTITQPWWGGFFGTWTTGPAVNITSLDLLVAV